MLSRNTLRNFISRRTNFVKLILTAFVTLNNLSNMELYNEELPALIDPDDDVVFQSNSNDSFNSQDTVKATSKSEIQIDNEDFKSLVHS